MGDFPLRLPQNKVIVSKISKSFSYSVWCFLGLNNLLKKLIFDTALAISFSSQRPDTDARQPSVDVKSKSDICPR